MSKAERALPDCPTCGGTANLELRGGQLMSCPDCDNGKVTVEQLVATWQALEAEWVALNELDSWTREEREMVGLLIHLRSVRPPSPKEGT